MILKKWMMRMLAVALTLSLLAAIAVIPATADNGAAPYTTAETISRPRALAIANETQTQNIFVRIWNFFWRHFQILSFSVNPAGLYMFNSRWSFQWIFGYNPAYNMFAPAIGASIDTLSNHFYYDDQNWKIVLWKGTYGWGTATGAEIGLYTRPPERMIAHYDCARYRDWIDMGFCLYYVERDNSARHIVTRPMENRWWQTAYALHLSRRWFDSPRDPIVLIGEIDFNTEGKAQAFVGALIENGLVEVDRPIVFEEDCYDRFAINGANVRFSWRTALGNNCPIRGCEEWSRDGQFLTR